MQESTARRTDKQIPDICNGFWGESTSLVVNDVVVFILSSGYLLEICHIFTFPDLDIGKCGKAQLEAKDSPR